MKFELKSISVILLLFFCLIILSSSVDSLGLNYRTTSISVQSGEKFCIEDYYLFNTANESMAGYLTVEGDLIRFLPYYDLLKQKNDKEAEKISLQDQINNLTSLLNQKKSSGENYSSLEVQLGVLDARMETLEKELPEILKQIQEADKKEVIEVPGLDQAIITKYAGDSDALRKYLIENNLLRQTRICLQAPDLEKEIQGECYTKYYSGQAVLIPSQISQLTGTGSTVAMRVSAPLDIRVRCGKIENKNLGLIVGLIILVVAIIIAILIMLVKRARRKKW